MVKFVLVFDAQIIDDFLEDFLFVLKARGSLHEIMLSYILKFQPWDAGFRGFLHFIWYTFRVMVLAEVLSRQ